MDATTMQVLDKGRKNARMLVQPQHTPMPVEQQIAVLYCGTHGLMRDLDVEQVPEFERLLSGELEHTGVYATLRQGVLDDSVTAAIEAAAGRIAATLTT